MWVALNGVDTPITTHYLLDGQNVVQEYQDPDNDGTFFETSGALEAGAVTATYGLGARGIEYKQDSSGTRTYYLYDGLGSVIATTTEMDNDGNLTVTPTPRTDVYGNPVTAETGSNHRFVGGLGHTTDSDTGLIYMRARYYDPAVGRFVSEDPSKNGDNWYAYCNGNPLSFVDSSGRAIQMIVAALVVAVVGLAFGTLGYYLGYMLAVRDIQNGDPDYNVKPSIAPGVIGGGLQIAAAWLYGISGGGSIIGISKIICQYAGPLALAFFLIGAYLGAVEAYNDDAMCQQYMIDHT